jgi:deoxyhypusine synthase
MPSRHEEANLEGVKTLSIRDRKSKVALRDFARPLRAGMTVAELIESLPDLLAARDLRTLLDRLERAIRDGREWIVLMGGHVVKTGLAPVLDPMVEDRWIRCLAMNGSGAVHDVEIALFGRTSEVVEENLADGSFGMARETAEFLNEAAGEARDRRQGLGERLGEKLHEAGAPHAAESLLATAHRAGVPATVHVALGTDIVHQHPSARGDAIGDASLRDFRILAARVAALQGGVVTNLGSAVLLPEVFLKALTVARNLGHEVEDFAAANFDMIRHYRPITNVVSRPTAGKGWGAHLTGHHEILIPLLGAALRDRLGAFRAPGVG